MQRPNALHCPGTLGLRGGQLFITRKSSAGVLLLNINQELAAILRSLLSGETRRPFLVNCPEWQAFADQFARWAHRRLWAFYKHAAESCSAFTSCLNFWMKPCEHRHTPQAPFYILYIYLYIPIVYTLYVYGTAIHVQTFDAVFWYQALFIWHLPVSFCQTF